MWPIRQFYVTLPIANLQSVCLHFLSKLRAWAMGGTRGGSRATTNTYSHMFLKLICDPGLKLDLTSYIFGVPSRLGCKIRDFLPAGQGQGNEGIE